MNPFVGTCTLSETQFREVLTRLATPPSYYYLRWVDQVSGFIRELPTTLSPEGQMFNTQLELRWQRQGENYQALLLSIQGGETEFTPLEEEWRVENRKAYVYPQTETRFPKPITTLGINVAQRYFINAQTGTVHFIALTP